MKRTILIVCILLAGIAMVSYPLVSDYLSKVNGSFAIESYSKEVAEISDEELQAAWDEAVTYNETLSGSPAHDPFLEGSGMALQDNYYEVLNIDETMGYIEIPKVKIKLPFYHGTSDEVLHKGVGHLEGSSLPVGGSDTHTVLTGHTGLSNAKLFTDIQDLVEGDLFYIHVLDQVLAYKVDQIKIVEPANTEDLKRVQGKDYATLLTCTPYGVNSHRLLVRGERTDYNPEEAAAIEPIDSRSEADRAVLIAAGCTAVIMLVFVRLTTAVSKRR